MDDRILLLKQEIPEKKYIDLLNRINDPILQFQNFLRKSEPVNKQKIDLILSKILGTGEGSTPQADDMIIGIIVTLIAIESELDFILNTIQTIPLERFTTQKSAIMIRKILRKSFPKEIQPFINLLVKDTFTPIEKIQFIAELRKIRAIGASSGIFFLVGVLKQLEFFEFQKQNLKEGFQ